MARRHRGRGRRHSGRPGGDDRAHLQGPLVRLWRDLAGTREPPALDRWLAGRLRGLDGLPRDDRLWLGDLITDAVRFGPLTVFAEGLRHDPEAMGAGPSAMLERHGSAGDAALWRRLTRLPPAVVFFWTFMRKRLTGADLPAVAPPGPGAAEIWRALRDAGPEASVPSLRLLWSGLPATLGEELERRGQASRWSDAERSRFCDRQASRPPLWLRAAPGEADAVDAELRAAGFDVEARGQALAACGPTGVFELPSVRSGRAVVQDFASQAIGRAVGAQSGESIWDCCAGAGGKSLQLSAAVGPGGAVLSSDIHPAKLKDLERRRDRCGAANIATQVHDAAAGPPADAPFDRVLVDAPCSGSGTWRRNPDGRYRADAADRAALVEAQIRILSGAAAAVRPGGALVYATCSWFVAENEGVAADFAERAPGFTLESMRLHGNPAADADTTFTAVFRRAVADDPPRS